MKKLLVLGVLFLMSLGLSSCGNYNNSSSTNSTSTSTSNSSKLKDVNGNVINKVGQKSDVSNGMSMTVTKFEKRTDIDVSKLKNILNGDDIAVVAYVKFDNYADADTSINITDFSSMGGNIIDISQELTDGEDVNNLPSDLTIFPETVNFGDKKEFEILLTYNSGQSYLYNISYGGTDWQQKKG